MPAADSRDVSLWLAVAATLVAPVAIGLQSASFRHFTQKDLPHDAHRTVSGGVWAVVVGVQ